MEAPPALKLLLFVEGVRYDEATRMLRVPQAADIEVDQARPCEGLPEKAARAFTSEDAISEIVPAKTFQTECKWGALLRIDGDEGPEYVFLTSEVATAPQILQRTTGACFAEAFLMSSTVRRSALATKFAFCMRLICSDRYAAQLLAERTIERMHAHWHRLHLACEVHMNAGALAKALLLVDSAISGCIRLALSLRVGGWMRVFRQALLTEVSETLEIKFGQSSDAEKRYRRIALTIFTGGRKRRRLVQSIMHVLPNGNWLLRDVVEVYVPEGSLVDRDVVVRVVARGLLKSLSWSQLPIFNRSRWTNNDDCICRLGLLEVCHGLLTRVYKRFLRMVGFRGSIDNETPAGQQLRPAVEGMAHGPAAIMDAMPVDGDGDDMPVDGDGDAHGPAAIMEAMHGDPSEMPASEGPVLPTSDEGKTDHAKQNAINRTMAIRWLNQHPLRDLVLIRLIMEPCMAMLRSQLWIGSAAWEKRQFLKGMTVSAGEGVRDFRLLIAAQGKLESQFADHLRSLMSSPALWSVLPPEAFTEDTLCLAFRMASREGAEVERLIARPHRKPPFLLFLSLLHPHVAADLKRMPTHMLDSFTSSFMSHFDVESLDGRAALMMIMVLGFTDTARVECWHAWLARLSKRLGAQTHRPNFRDASAKIFSQRVKVREAEQRQWHPGFKSASAPPGSDVVQGEAPADDEGDQEPDKKKEARWLGVVLLLQPQAFGVAPLCNSERGVSAADA